MMPNQPKTPNRSVRVPEDLWQAAQAKAQMKGETVTDVIVRALKRYTQTNLSVPAPGERPGTGHAQKGT